MNNLPKRKPNRLKGYDYSQDGAYFITICAKDKKCRFGRIEFDSVGADIIRPLLSKTGVIAKQGIENIAQIYSNVIVEDFVIMPNHIHMIIVIEAMGGRMISAPTLSKIIAYFKQFVSRKVGYSPWQRSFYDHIIRDEEDYLRIVEYIENNPLKWELDLLYVEE